MMEFFCTYSDRNYLPQLISLIRSLENHLDINYRLYILCLDDVVFEVLNKLNYKNIILITHKKFLEDAPNQKITITNRKRLNYYYTCTPVLMRLVLLWEPLAQRVTYLDADLFLFNNLNGYFEEIKSHDIVILEHLKNCKKNHLHGKFNVSILTFTKEDNALNCLNWWEQETFKSTEFNDVIWGDQKYLDYFPIKFKNVHIIENIGIGAAPWNINYYEISNKNNKVYVDNSLLLVYHFARLILINKYLFIPARRSNIKHSALINIYSEYFKSLTESLDLIKNVYHSYRIRYFFRNFRGLILSIFSGRVFYQKKNKLQRLGININLFYEDS